MQLAEVSVRRPVLAVVMSLLIVLIGAVSFKSLSLREYPEDRRAHSHRDHPLCGRIGRGR